MALNNTVRVAIETPDPSIFTSIDPKSMPLYPGNNWTDNAFRKTHPKVQTLQGEFAGRTCYAPNGSGVITIGGSRATLSTQAGLTADSSVFRIPMPDSPMPEVDSVSAYQLGNVLAVSRLRGTRGAPSIYLKEKKTITLDDKILHFYAYFEEPVPESPTESIRVRPVEINYYTDDETISISEPRVVNSGLRGGLLLKRGKVPVTLRMREQFPDDDHININHLNVNKCLKMYGTFYYIFDCDAFTRQFMEDLGIDVPPPQDCKEDTFAYSARLRREMLEIPGVFGIKSQDHTVENATRGRRFIQDSGKVLRFYGQWDDRENIGGTVHKLEVRYYIDDDTMSIKESQSSTEVVSGVFLSKRRLPKDGKYAKASELTFAGRVNGIRETFLGQTNAYYCAQDLYVGMHLNVFGRNIVIIDADDYTRDYFIQNFGIELNAGFEGYGIPEALNSTSFEDRRPAEVPVPPYTGYGAEDDSLASCKRLVLKVPLKPPALADDEETLRYNMQFYEPSWPDDRNRRFVLHYYTDDGEVMIQERPLKNTGIDGGRWLRRQRLRTNPDDWHSKPQYLTLDQINVGAILNINKFYFRVMDMDEHSANYLARKEDRKAALTGVSVEDDPVSHDELMAVLKNLYTFVNVHYVNLTVAFRAFDEDKNGKITIDEMKLTLKHNNLTKKENVAVAVLRALDKDKLGYINYPDWMTAFGSKHGLNINLDNSNVSHASIEEQPSSNSQMYRSSAVEKGITLLRNKVLRKLKERLEARCLNGFEMFRMISTQPRAMRGRRGGADIMTLTNIEKDAGITPVQLRRCVQDTLGMMLTEPEMNVLLGFFFAMLNPSEYNRPVDLTKVPVLELNDFQTLFNEMVRIGTLDESPY
eukprot:Tbor_TRINITY_DN5788_c6_g1::TRINITY_DN5788_c6_g1_i2::g.20651::m.20651